MAFSEYKDVFAAEAREYIQSLNENLLQFEQSPANKELVTEMFRAAHSLKGMAGTMGYTELADFTHHMENLLDALRNDQIAASTELVNTLFECVDSLEVMLQEVIDEDQVSIDVAVLKHELEQLLSGGAPPRDVSPEQAGSATATATGTADNFRIVLDEYDRELIRQGIDKNYSALAITVVLRKNVLLKSVRAYTVFQALERLGTIIKSVPSAQDLDEERFDDRFAVVLLSTSPASDVEEAVWGIPEIVEVHVKSLDPEEIQSPATRVSAGTSAAASTSQNSGTGEDSRDKPGSRSRLIEKFVRVETERLDELNNLVGELVISRTQVLEITRDMEAPYIKNAVAQLDRVTTDLQYAAMKLRMVPVKQVFDRFPRMVRDLSQAAGKKVRLQVVGEETELDRSIINQIGDPLVHLLRNAVDHGLETAEERLSAGKPETGTIRLEARHEGSHVVIEVADDGRGIDVEKIKQKAVQRNIITADQAAKMTPQEARSLIFQPGFSTADQVTDVSGRGVGMDAVKAALEAMNGSVDVVSREGQGTTVSLKLPLTLAIIKALLVKVASDTYAIPIQAVRENLRVPPEDVKTIRQERVITLRNEVLPLLDLSERLGFGALQREGALPVIVVEASSSKVGLIVDELLGQQEVVIKSLSPILGDVPGVAGATVLGSGQVALILDVSGLLHDLQATFAE